MAHPMKTALILAAGLALPALAQDGSRLQPGLWESAIQMNGVALGTMQMCMDGSPETMAANLRARAAQAQAKADCTKPDNSLVPGGRRIEVSCTTDGHVMHSVMTLTGDMQTHMHVSATTSRDGGQDIKNDMDMRRSGECPAGMKPGDTKVQMDPNSLGAMAKAFGRTPPAGQ